MSDIQLPSLTRGGDLLSTEKSAAAKVLENPFINSAAHTFIQGPVDAVSQVIDKTTGSNLLPNLRLIPDARKAEFGSGDWLQQQAGAAVGALPYLVLLHQGSRAMLSERMLSADTRLMLDAGVKLGSTGVQQVARLELASAGLTGATYSGLLTPVHPEEMQSTSGFLGAKFRDAAVGGATFMTLTGSMLGTKSLAEGLKPGFIQTALKSDLGAGIVSGLPAGVVSAQADSLLRGNGLASWKDTSESALGFAMIGGLMPAGQKGLKMLSERVPASASQTIPIERVSARDATQLQNPGEAPVVKPLEQVFKPHEIKTLSEWKDVQKDLPETKFRETDPEMIKRLADEAYGQGAPTKGRRLDILLGNCGAGKSRITDALAKEVGAMTPDSDHIKAQIPGYDKGMGNQAVHEDSSAAYKILLDRALKTGDNIVWQGVGKTASSVIDLINQAKANGYEVHVHMIDAPPEVAAQRVYNRANGEPDANGIRQMIPPEVPLNPKYQYVPRLNFFKMVGDAAKDFQATGQKQIDGYRLWRSTSTLSSQLPTGAIIPSVRPMWLPVERANNDDDHGANLFNVNKPEEKKK